MNNQIQTFIDYLLDSETTSEIAFIENIHKNNEFFQLRYFKDWELTIFRKLQQVHRNTIVTTLNNVDNGQKSESDASDEESTTTTSSSEDEEQEENKDKNTSEKGHVNIYRLYLFILYNVFFRINIQIKQQIFMLILFVNVNDFFDFYIIVINITITLPNFIFTLSINVSRVIMRKLLLLFYNK
jgi:hypothetical protein